MTGDWLGPCCPESSRLLLAGRLNLDPSGSAAICNSFKKKNACTLSQSIKLANKQFSKCNKTFFPTTSPCSNFTTAPPPNQTTLTQYNISMTVVVLHHYFLIMQSFTVSCQQLNCGHFFIVSMSKVSFIYKIVSVSYGAAQCLWYNSHIIIISVNICAAQVCYEHLLFTHSEIFNNISMFLKSLLGVISTVFDFNHFSEFRE